MFREVLVMCLVAGALATCPMRPSAEQSRTQKQQGDGGYKILISGGSDKYIPNAIYTISLQGE